MRPLLPATPFSLISRHALHFIYLGLVALLILSPLQAFAQEERAAEKAAIGYGRFDTKLVGTGLAGACHEVAPSVPATG